MVIIIIYNIFYSSLLILLLSSSYFTLSFFSSFLSCRLHDESLVLMMVDGYIMRVFFIFFYNKIK